MQVRLVSGLSSSLIEMQFYHHPYSLDSQKVRLALEEKAIDYTSHHVNPITGKNMDAFFFRLNPTAELPVFQNGSHVIYDTIEIIKYVCLSASLYNNFLFLHQSYLLLMKVFWEYGVFRYIERIAAVSSAGVENVAVCSSQQVLEWMNKIQKWDPKYFTLFHIPDKYRRSVSKFLRRIIIARMAESPDMASAYHIKLREAYETEEKLSDPQVLRHAEEYLVRLLDEAETQLGETSYLVGEEFSMADVMFIPLLARLELLNLEQTYIADRPNIVEYWNMMKQRPSYKKVIGRYFDGWRRHKTFMKTWCLLKLRTLLHRY